MGYMGLSCVCDSDSASDLSFEIEASIVDSLAKGLEDPGNAYNTDGPVNVALIFEENIIPGQFVRPALIALAEETASRLKDKIDNIGDLEDWGGDESNRNEHLGAYTRLKRKLDHYVEENE